MFALSNMDGILISLGLRPQPLPRRRSPSTKCVSCPSLRLHWCCWFESCAAAKSWPYATMLTFPLRSMMIGSRFFLKVKSWMELRRFRFGSLNLSNTNCYIAVMSFSSSFIFRSCYNFAIIYASRASFFARSFLPIGCLLFFLPRAPRPEPPLFCTDERSLLLTTLRPTLLLLVELRTLLSII